jgi:hypothetical protein
MHHDCGGSRISRVLPDTFLADRTLLEAIVRAHVVNIAPGDARIQPHPIPPGRRNVRRVGNTTATGITGVEQDIGKPSESEAWPPSSNARSSSRPASSVNALEPRINMNLRGFNRSITGC